MDGAPSTLLGKMSDIAGWPVVTTRSSSGRRAAGSGRPNGTSALTVCWPARSNSTRFVNSGDRPRRGRDRRGSPQGDRSEAARTPRYAPVHGSTRRSRGRVRRRACARCAAARAEAPSCCADHSAYSSAAANASVGSTMATGSADRRATSERDRGECVIGGNARREQGGEVEGTGVNDRRQTRAAKRARSRARRSPDSDPLQSWVRGVQMDEVDLAAEFMEMEAELKRRARAQRGGTAEALRTLPRLR